jgi:outer membrane receptor protein involved in Fe transport
MYKKSFVWGFFLVTVAGISDAPAVYAQAASNVDRVEAAESRTTPPILEEVVVTARRVPENVHDLPAAVTVVGGAALADLLVIDTRNLIEQIPGASLVTSGPGYIADTSLRGQGGGRVATSESATGLYRDGHYVAGGNFGGRALNRLELFDLERVEVLRGPQGALYGRNAIGGSINAIANKPDFDGWGGWAKIGYDSFDTIDVESAVNVPLSDALAARVAAFYSNQGDGSITNVITGNTVDREHVEGVRAALAWQISDSVDTRLTYEGFYNRTPAFGNPAYRATLYNGAPLDPGIFKRVLSSESYARIKQNAVYWDTRIATDHGDWHVNLDYRYRRGERLDEDLDHYLGFQGVVLGGTEVEIFADQTATFESGGVQIYLTSPTSLEGWTWLVGIDGLANESNDLTVNRGTATLPGLRTLFRDDDSAEELRSGAVYGALGHDLAPRWNLGLELRVQRDRKTMVFDRSPNQPSSLITPIFVDLEHEWTKVLPAVTLRHELNDSQNAYLRFSTGYRPGGFNTGIPGDTTDAAALIPFEPESVYGGELGWKIFAFDDAWTLNVAAYYTRTNDVQVVTSASPTNPTYILQNAGDDEIYGIELETRGRIDFGSARLDLSAALASNDGTFDDGTSVLDNTGQVVDISGRRVNQTRDFQATLGATLRFPIGESVMASLGANLQTESGGYENATNTTELANFTLLDLTASLAVDRWTIFAWARNVADENYPQFSLNGVEFYNTRRQFGVSVKYAF